jgi:transcriptional regulator with XRE-family HTH domain
MERISMKNFTGSDIRELRKKLGLNQSQFWSKLGVTQSGGSRYESGRNIPRPVQALLRLVHVEQIDVNKIKREDWEVAQYLKATDSEKFKELKKEARAWVKTQGKSSTAADEAESAED